MAKAAHPHHLEISSSEVSEARYFQSWELPDTLAFPDHIGSVIEAWKSAAADNASLVVESNTAD